MLGIRLKFKISASLKSANMLSHNFDAQICGANIVPFAKCWVLGELEKIYYRSNDNVTLRFETLLHILKVCKKS